MVITIQTTAEVSLFPSTEHYKEPINAFIEALNAYTELTVQSFPSSTVVIGDHDRLMDILKIEMKHHRQE